MSKNLLCLSSIVLFLSSLGYSQNTGFSEPDFLFTHAFQSDNRLTAVPFVNYIPDAKSSALGNAGVVAANDAFAIHWNTAKIHAMEPNSQISASYLPLRRNILENANYAAISAYTKLKKKHAIGTYLNYNFGNYLNTIYNETSFTIAYAYNLSKRSSIGVNSKLIYSDLYRTQLNIKGVRAKDITVAFDLSYYWENPDLKIGNADATVNLGASVANLGKGMIYFDSTDYAELPSYFRLASSIELKTKEHHSFLPILQLNRALLPYISTSNAKENPILTELRSWEIGGGFQYSYLFENASLSARVGMYSSHPNIGNRKILSFGLGASIKQIKVDASYITSLRYGSSENGEIRFTLAYTFLN